jgi:hypothetical protein
VVHDLRRSAVKNMVRAGLSELYRDDDQRHQTESTFCRYNIVSTSDMVYAFEKLETCVGAAPASKIAVLSQFGHNSEPFESSTESGAFDLIEEIGGAERGRTVDLLNAIQALSQLSYSPTALEGFQLTG